MNMEHLNRLIRLTKKTGDTVIISDTDGDSPVVLMGLDRYESMLDIVLGEDVEQKPISNNNDSGIELEDHSSKLQDSVDDEYAAPPVLDDVFENANMTFPNSVKPVESYKKNVMNEEVDVAVDYIASTSNPSLGLVKEDTSKPHQFEGEERFYLEPIE